MRYHFLILVSFLGAAPSVGIAADPSCKCLTRAELAALAPTAFLTKYNTRRRILLPDGILVPYPEGLSRQLAANDTSTTTSTSTSTSSTSTTGPAPQNQSTSSAAPSSSPNAVPVAVLAVRPNGPGTTLYHVAEDFGTGECRAHSAGVTPDCAQNIDRTVYPNSGTALSSPPPTCSRSWCFVDVRSCAASFSPFATETIEGSHIGYSFKTCGTSDTVCSDPDEHVKLYGKAELVVVVNGSVSGRTTPRNHPEGIARVYSETFPLFNVAGFPF